MAGFREPWIRLLRTVYAASFVFAIIAVVTTQACYPPSHDPPDESVTDVSQAVAGDCGYTDVCLVRSACTSWDLHSAGDGLGFSVSSWNESGGETYVDCSLGSCFGDVNGTDCEDAAVARRNGLISLRSGISQPALNGFTISVTEAVTNYWETSDCGQGFDPRCAWNQTSSCTFHITNFPTPLTGVHDWCPCAQFQPVTCAPSSVVVAGDGHTCALVGGGVQCWGSNSEGQLGNGSSIPHSVQRVQVSGLTDGVYTVSAGRAHNCSIKQGVARCWGDNSHGQIGNGQPGDDTTTLPDSKMPVAVSGLPNRVQAIVAGNAHTCAVVDGGARCWGSNDFGQLGDGTNQDRHSPSAVNGLLGNVQAVAAGASHSCAIVGGAAKCWGINDNGQLGNATEGSPTPGDSNVPVQVTGLTSGVQAIATGLLHTCALVSGGVRCWGDNSSGQLGTGIVSTIPVRAPIPVPGLSGVSGITVGERHSCAILTTGAIKCWGANTNGELGNGDVSGPNPTPSDVNGLSSGAQTVATGYRHTCAIASSRIKCWGDNSTGQLALDPDVSIRSAVPLTVPEVVCGAGTPPICQAVGCADGTNEQAFSGGMVGCAGTVTYANRGTLCAPGYQPATAVQWTTNRGGAAPTHNYWTNDSLRYNGSGNACFVSTTIGTVCSSNTPMRVCTPGGTDAEGNICNWKHCGLNTTLPDQFFGGCEGNPAAGTLCVPAP